MFREQFPGSRVGQRLAEPGCWSAPALAARSYDSACRCRRPELRLKLEMGTPVRDACSLVDETCTMPLDQSTTTNAKFASNDRFPKHREGTR